MATISLYVVVDDDEDPIAFEAGTPNYDEARDAARRLNAAVLEHEYEWADSSVVADFREPGKRAIGFEDRSE